MNMFRQIADALKQFNAEAEELEADWDAADRTLQEGLASVAEKFNRKSDNFSTVTVSFPDRPKYATREDVLTAAKAEIDAKIIRGE